MSAQPLDIRLEEGERLRKLDIDEEAVCQDIAEVVSKRPYFTTNACTNNFHIFKRTDRGLEAFHSDDSLCDHCEYFLPLNI